MPRSLKYEIPGPDWRRSAIDLTEAGIEGLFADTFEAPFELVVEIGFGRGEFLLDLATRSPDVPHLGVEVSFKRVLKMARKLAVTRLENTRIIEARGEVVVGQFLLDSSVREMWINFSDPWPKDRQAHRRLIQPSFIADVSRVLAPGGALHIATDDVPYAEQIDAVLRAEGGLENHFAPEGWRPEIPGRMHTGYETDWRREGRSLHFFEYRRPDAEALRQGGGFVTLPQLDLTEPARQVRELNLKDHDRPSLRARFAAEGVPAYRADQIFSWLYRRDVDDIAEMTDLSVELRESLARTWETQSLEVSRVATSVDGTRKLVLRTRDGEVLESVLIPEERRNTLCVSTQVGCPLACSFCATGALGLKRNLAVAEIVDQVLHARRAMDADETLTNIVFMGMGEPLLNWDAVAASIRILTDPKGLAMAPRRITVSTSGIVTRIRPLIEIGPINLAISLHATTDAVRDELVPLNRRFPLATLLGELRALAKEGLLTRKRPVFFEYTLMEGVNDSLEDARRLPGLLHGIPAKLNVIPMNPHADAPQRPPSAAVCDRFTAALHDAGMRVTLRRNRGRDIDAACGQLAAREQRAGVEGLAE